MNRVTNLFLVAALLGASSARAEEPTKTAAHPRTDLHNTVDAQLEPGGAAMSVDVRVERADGTRLLVSMPLKPGQEDTLLRAGFRRVTADKPAAARTIRGDRMFVDYPTANLTPDDAKRLERQNVRLELRRSLRGDAVVVDVRRF
jgi:hypothetical protein